MKRVIRVFHPGVLPAMRGGELGALWLGLIYLAWDGGVIQSTWVAAGFAAFCLARVALAVYRATHETFVVPMTMGVREIEDDDKPEGQ